MRLIAAWFSKIRILGFSRRDEECPFQLADRQVFRVEYPARECPPRRVEVERPSPRLPGELPRPTRSVRGSAPGRPARRGRPCRRGKAPPRLVGILDVGLEGVPRRSRRWRSRPARSWCSTRTLLLGDDGDRALSPPGAETQTGDPAADHKKLRHLAHDVSPSAGPRCLTSAGSCRRMIKYGSIARIFILSFSSGRSFPARTSTATGRDGVVHYSNTQPTGSHALPSEGPKLARPGPPASRPSGQAG